MIRIELDRFGYADSISLVIDQNNRLLASKGKNREERWQRILGPEEYVIGYMGKSGGDILPDSFTSKIESDFYMVLASSPDSVRVEKRRIISFDETFEGDSDLLRLLKEN